YDGGFEAGLSPEVGGLLGVMLEEEREGEEGAIVDSYADLESYLHNYDVNTPPRSVITFSDL
ncbi:MAG: hypothetical protein AAB456_02350, partial [Patescibacteria group bacterium]